MAKPLRDILERQFSLSYHGVMSHEEYAVTDLKKIEWMYGRLIQQKRDEDEARKRIPKGKNG